MSLFDEKPNLDFSQFHALDHPVWARQCALLYGGRRTHLKYWWEFKGYRKMRRLTCCWRGKHEKTTMTAFKPGVMPKPWWWRRPICVNCYKSLGPKRYNSENS